MLYLLRCPKPSANRRNNALATTSWASEGGAVGPWPPGFWKFQQKMLFSSFRVGKTKFYQFWQPLEWFWKNPLMSPPGKNPDAHAQHIQLKFFEAKVAYANCTNLSGAVYPKMSCKLQKGLRQAHTRFVLPAFCLLSCSLVFSARYSYMNVHIFFRSAIVKRIINCTAPASSM